MPQIGMIGIPQKTYAYMQACAAQFHLRFLITGLDQQRCAGINPFHRTAISGNRSFECQVNTAMIG